MNWPCHSFWHTIGRICPYFSNNFTIFITLFFSNSIFLYNPALLSTGFLPFSLRLSHPSLIYNTNYSKQIWWGMLLMIHCQSTPTGHSFAKLLLKLPLKTEPSLLLFDPSVDLWCNPPWPGWQGQMTENLEITCANYPEGLCLEKTGGTGCIQFCRLLNKPEFIFLFLWKLEFLNIRFKSLKICQWTQSFLRN